MRKIIVTIMQPVYQEPVFFVITTILMYIIPFVYDISEEGIDFSFYPLRNILITLSVPLFFSWGLCYVIWKSGLRFLKPIVYIVLFMLTTTELFLLLNFKTTISPWIIMLVNETNHQESSEFLSRYLVSTESMKCYICITFAAIITSILENKKKSKRFYEINPFNTLAAVILTAFLLLGCYLTTWAARLPFLNSSLELETWVGLHGGYAKQNSPINLLLSLKMVQVSKHDNEEAINATLKAAKQPAICNYNDSLNIILIIGESFNKYHSPLYGYTLNTTPRMLSMQMDSSLFVFQDAVSPYNMTSLAVKNLLSTNSLIDGEPWYSSPSFPVIFKNAGYFVSIWDNQHPNTYVSFYDFAMSAYMYTPQMINTAYNECSTKPYDYDFDMTHAFIKHREKRPRHRLNLHILHLLGQHSNAANRFPDNAQMKKFKPSDINRPDLNEEKRQEIADYDNATYYNDMVIASIIEYFSNTSAVMVYLSDHGEEVYDYRNHIGRSHEKNKTKQAVKYQFDIPFMVWCSEQYRQKNQETVKSLINALDKPLSLDDTAHMLFHLGQIETPYYRSNRDIISNGYQIKHRIVQEHIDYEEL